MKLMIISSSHRVNSQSYRVGTMLKENCKLNSFFHEIELFDLQKINLDFWSEKLEEQSILEWSLLSNNFKLSDAFIFVIPEWHGMVPAKFKNLLLFCNKNEISHKPALLISISSGNGGSYALAELRINSHKNTKVCYIPEAITIRQVELFELNHTKNTRFIEYIESCFYVLYNYAIALKSVRSSNFRCIENFPHGM